MRVYSQWLALALLRGEVLLQPQGVALKFDRFSKFYDASEFLGRRWGWVDPLKDAQASRELLNARLTTRTRIAAEQGIDFADLVVELAAEEKMLEDAGLDPILASSPPAAPPTQSTDGSQGNGNEEKADS
jgi:capsid protein